VSLSLAASDWVRCWGAAGGGGGGGGEGEGGEGVGDSVLLLVELPNSDHNDN